MEFTSAASLGSASASSYSAYRVLTLAEKLDAAFEGLSLLGMAPHTGGSRAQLVGYPANPTFEELSAASFWLIPCMVCHLGVRLFFGNKAVELAFCSDGGIEPHAVGAYATSELFQVDLPSFPFTVAAVGNVLNKMEMQGWVAKNYASTGPKNCIEFCVAYLRWFKFTKHDLERIWQENPELRRSTFLFYCYKAARGMGAFVRVGAAAAKKPRLQNPGQEDEKMKNQKMKIAKQVSQALNNMQIKEEAQLVDEIAVVLREAAETSTSLAELLDVFESFSTDVKPQFFDDDDVVSGEPLNSDKQKRVKGESSLTAALDFSALVSSEVTDADVRKAIAAMLDDGSPMAELVRSGQTDAEVRAALRAMMGASE